MGGEILGSIRLTLPAAHPKNSEEINFKYVKEIKASAGSQFGKKPILVPVRLYVMFYVDRGASSMSLPELLKPVLRGLRRIVYMDESQIHQLSVGKVLVVGTETPKTELIIETLT